MRRLRLYFRRSFADRLLLLEALGWLVLAKALVHGIPFRWLAVWLGKPMAQSPEAVGLREQEIAKRMGWAVEAVARHSPVAFVCLPQAIAAKWMLRRRGLASTLYLGVKLKEVQKNELMAHAWVRVGDRILTGRQQSFHHKKLASFA